MDEFVRRLEELLGETNVWQEHKSSTPEPVPEPVTEPVAEPEPEPEPNPASQPVKSPETQKAETRVAMDVDSPGSSSSPRASEPVSILKPVSWPGTGLTKGDRSAKGESFCSWQMVRNYPHMYIGKTNADRARPFFEPPALFQYHPWDLYYIYNPSDLKNRHILLVPTYQFERLLDVINAKLGIKLTIPGQKNAAKFRLTFGMGGAPLPRFLGRCTSNEVFESLQQSLPPWNPADDLREMSTMAQEDFIEMLKTIQSNSKGSKSNKSEKNRRKRIQDHKSWGMAMKRVQRYLGLRERASLRGSIRSTPKAGETDFLPLANMSLSDSQSTTAPDMGNPFRGKPEGSVVFVSMDIEAFEFSQDVVTEIGVAVFDTLDICNQSPGARGENWFHSIKGSHFRIKENSWAQNNVHVQGCADKFDFGKTEFIEMNQIKGIITRVIEHATSPGDQENKHRLEKRPMVLVFHDSAADLAYLERLRYDVSKIKNLLEIVDTRDMYQHAVKAMNPASLERVLADLQIPSRYLHNAGNDAVYTLQAMIGLAIQQRKKSLERAAENDHDATSLAKHKDDEGWETGGEEEDGGKAGQKAELPPTGPMNPLKGKGFQPGNDIPRAASPPASNVFSWSDNEDAEHLEDW